MKKIIAITLLLAMALCLCACGSDNKEARYVGTWQTNDETTTLTLNEDGSASLVVTGENAATYNMKWVATGVFNITLSWDGEPVPAPVTEEDVEDTVDTTEEVVEETVDEAVEETVADVPVEETGAADAAATATTGTTKRNDPSVVGYGSLKVVNGELWLYFAEGSNTDVLLFTYGFKKI